MGCNQSAAPEVFECEPELIAHYPLADGASWTYRHQKPGAEDWLEDIDMSGSECEFEISDVGDPNDVETTSVLRLQDRAVWRVAKQEQHPGGTVVDVEYDPGFLRFDARWVNGAPGDAAVHEYSRTERVDGSANTEPRSHTFHIESLSETVEVPAGIFEDCIEIRRVRQSNLQTKTYWYAPGVGKVREHNLANGHIEELIEYEVPD